MDAKYQIMLLVDQIIADDEIAAIKQYFQTNLDTKYTNWQIGDQVIDYRVNINEHSPEFDIIRNIVSRNFDRPLRMWSAYQRQSIPHNIHIDDYESEDRNNCRYTYVLAMDTVPQFRTIVWKERCWDNEELHRFVDTWGKMRRFKKKASNISETQDLEHTYDENQQDYMCDYLTLDGVYTYKTGTACLFDATQLHCTSNWVKYPQFPYRELLQIHVLNDSPVDC